MSKPHDYGFGHRLGQGLRQAQFCDFGLGHGQIQNFGLEQGLGQGRTKNLELGRGFDTKIPLTSDVCRSLPTIPIVPFILCWSGYYTAYKTK